MLLKNPFLCVKIEFRRTFKEVERKMKKEYINAELEIINLAAADIITSSGSRPSEEDNWTNYH